MTPSIFQGKYTIKITAVILIIFALCLNIYMMGYGVNFSDEPWHLLNAQEYESTSYMTRLNYLLGHWWGNIFGFTFISFRWLAFLLNATAIIIMVIPFHLAFRDWGKSLILIAVLLIFRIQQMWGYDRLSDLLWALEFGIFCFWFKRQALWIVAIIGSVGAIYTLVRFPNLVVVPISIICISLIDWSNRSNMRTWFKDIFTLLVSYLVALLILIILVFGSPQAFLEEMTHASASNTYTIVYLLGRYWDSLFLFLPYFYYVFTAFGILYFIYKELLLEDKNKWLPYLAIGITLYSTGYLYKNRDMYGHNLQYFMLAVMTITAIALTYYAFKKRTLRQKLPLLLCIIAFALIPPAGSNTGLTKIVTIYLIPIISIFVLQLKTNFFKIFFIATIAAAMLYSCIHRYCFLFEDSGLRYTNIEVQLPGHTLKTTAERAAFINEMDKLIKDSKANGQSLFFTGTNMRHLFDYLKGGRPEYSVPYFIANDQYVEETRVYLQNNPQDIVVQIMDYPENEIKDIETTPLSAMLHSLGYTVVDNSHSFYCIYKRQ